LIQKRDITIANQDSQRFRVLVTSYYDRVATDPVLARLAPVAEVTRLFPGQRVECEEFMMHLPETDVVLISDEEVDAAVLAAAPRLAMVCADGVGVNSVDVSAATAAGVIVNNAPFVHDSNGDFTVGVILALIRRIVVADNRTREGEWCNRQRYLGTGLSGRSLGLLGFGRAAQAVAKRAAGFGCQLLAYCRNPDAAKAERLNVKLVSFDELLSRSDILSLHVTLTEATRGMIGVAQFAQMKPGAYLINTSRGAVISESALVEALRSGSLAGAAVDVFTEEPPPRDHPLFAMENVIVTPHIASDDIGAFRAVFDGAVDDMLRFFRGDCPAHVVNPDVLSHPRCQHLASGAI
jgi:phosphoglycerate dehydrogenase-like enzyme